MNEPIEELFCQKYARLSGCTFDEVHHELMRRDRSFMNLYNTFEAGYWARSSENRREEKLYQMILRAITALREDHPTKKILEKELFMMYATAYAGNARPNDDQVK